MIGDILFSILDHEPGLKVPMIVQQTVDFIKNYGTKLRVHLMERAFRA